MKNFKQFLNESTQAQRDAATAARADELAAGIEKKIDAGGGTPEERKKLTRHRRTSFEKKTGIPFDMIADILGKSKNEAYTPSEDYEGEMATSELRNIIDNAKDIESMLKPESKLEAWVQSKITKANDYINSVRDYLKNTPGSVEEALDPVGQEDRDVNNDGVVDGTDSYLLRRRAAIKKSMMKRKSNKRKFKGNFK